MTRRMLFHNIMLFLVPLGGFITGGFFLYLMLHYVTIDPAKWSNFFNGTLPDMIAKAIFPIFIVYFLNWSHEGFPIRAILHITEAATVWQKFTAAFFLIGVAFIIAYSVKIG